MRKLIILCLCAASLAAPQGYNYNQGGISVQQPVAGGNFIGVSSLAAAGQYIQGGHMAQQSKFVGQQFPQQQQAIISKHFFIHSAPEDDDEEIREKYITVGVPKKNYNVVFIKSPSKTNKKTAIKISPAPNEEKTVIYVLSKKSDASDIHAEVVEHLSTTAKPEVFFVKYKTNEEANYAQAQIQAQYDVLGGSSQVTDEGIAPVTSVIGSVGGGDASSVTNSGFASNSGFNAHVSTSGGFGVVRAASSNLGPVANAGNSNVYLPSNTN